MVKIYHLPPALNTASASYWTFGPSLTYSTAAASMLVIAIVMKPLARKP